MVEAEKQRLTGPAGMLESILELPPNIRAAAVVCHPHPLHQGSMLNKVAHSLARASLDAGAAALRFNFRGVGASEGEHDHGKGEVDDALAAVHYMRERFPGLPVFLAGFSFGGGIAMLTALRTHCDALVTIAPAVNREGFRLPAQPQQPWLIIQGGADDVVASGDVLDWFNTLADGPELVLMDGVGHFFHGQLTPMRRQVMSFLCQQL